MKHPLLLILTISMFGFSKMYSQNTAVNLRKVFIDAEYFFINEDYQEALYAYNTIYKKGHTDNANINYRIGQCYLNIPGAKEQAIAYLEKACKKVSNNYIEGSYHEYHAPYDAYFFLGNAYRINYQFDKAIKAYEKFKELLGNKEKKAIKVTDTEIQACKNAVVMIKSPVKVGFINIGSPINTASKDFFPAVNSDESVIVYNSSQKFYEAVYFSKKVDNKWTTPINITPQIQSDGNQFVSSLSFDGTELYLREEDNFQANILVSKYQNGEWTKSVPLNKNINTKFWEGNACVSKDGTTLYFSSNKSGGYGEMDIYKSTRKPGGDWGTAVNLGPVINTDLNEDAPYITEDGKRLYFISQGHYSMGGYDIFYSDLGADGKWQETVNVGYPLNTPDDDLHFAPVRNGKSAYISLYSKEGAGNDDIFKVILVPEEIETAKIQNAEEPKLNEKLVMKVEPAKDTSQRILLPDVEKALTESKPNNKIEEELVVHSILFDFNSSVLDDKAKRELNYLSIIMQNEDSVKVELIGNTDSKGTDEYNLKLSRQRAENALTYLISKGVKPSRLHVKALGKKNFIALNNNADGTDNAEGRRYNRRVDFQLSDGTEKHFIIEKIEVPDSLQIKTK